MSETPETPTRPTAVATEPATAVVKPYWLYRFAAWVVIVAGIVFIAMSVFFAGFKIAGHHHHHHHWRHHPTGQHHAMGPGGKHHGHGPAGVHGGPGGPGGSASPGPSQPPQSVAPSLAPAHP